MQYAVDLDKNGYFTIPKEIIKFLDITPGQDKLAYNIVDGQVIVNKE